MNHINDAELTLLLSKLNINNDDKNINLIIMNLVAISAELKKIDSNREFFSVICEQQLRDFSKKITDRHLPALKSTSVNQSYNVLTRVCSDNMQGVTRYLSAIFIYSQLNTALLKGKTASPLVKTNRTRLRIFIEKVVKKNYT